MSVKSRAYNGSSSYLIFSHEVAGRTDIMSITDSHFCPKHIPGFNHEASTILVELLPDDALLQVTRSEVRVIPEKGSSPFVWAPPGGYKNEFDAANCLLFLQRFQVTYNIIRFANKYFFQSYLLLVSLYMLL